MKEITLDDIVLPPQVERAINGYNSHWLKEALRIGARIALLAIAQEPLEWKGALEFYRKHKGTVPESIAAAIVEFQRRAFLAPPTKTAEEEFTDLVKDFMPGHDAAKAIGKAFELGRRAEREAK